MRKVFTLFCVLMAAFFSIGVANAQSLVALQTSPKPTGDTFDANTHWFIMTLNGKFITKTVTDDSGNLKVSSTNDADISTDAAWWCVVGDATNGYTFYNKAAGTKKVLGLKNLTGNSDHLNTYGASRAQMYDATTTNSTELEKVGITFDFKTKSTDTETCYYVCLKGTNRYLNDRNSYLAYWENSGGLGDNGSRVKFYDASTYWYDKYLGSYKTFATYARNNVGTTAFTYPKDAVNTFENFVNEQLNNVSTNVTYTEAIRLEAYLQLGAAKWTLRKKINGPVAGSIYKIKSPYNKKFIHAPYSIAAGNDFPLSTTDNVRSIGWIFEPNTTNSTYKIKSADTGLYIGGTTDFKSVVNSSDATDFVIAAAADGGISQVVVGTGDDLSVRQWFHSNGADHVIAWDANGSPASIWEFTEVSVEDYKTFSDKRSNISLLPGVSDNEEVIAALTTYNNKVPRTVDDWNSFANVVNKVLEGKYYRINNLRNKIQDDYTILATDGNLKPKMYTTDESKYLVSTIWKFKVGNGGLLLSNVNNPNQYVAALTNATIEEGKTANDFTTLDNAELFVLSKADNVDYYIIRDVKGNLLNGEDSGNFPLNYWNGGLNQKSTQWQINEATSLEVALNNAGNEKSYASVYLPFSISSVNDGVKAYVAKEPETNEVTFTETTNGVMANKGFLLISDNAAATATVNIGESNTDSRMLGTLTNLNLTNEDKNTYRVFGRNSSNVVGFFTPSGTLNEVKANRGYFTVSNGGALRLNFEDSVVSGIDAIEANQALHNAPIFDLSGRRVMNTVKGGLYIQNGRKFIVK